MWDAASTGPSVATHVARALTAAAEQAGPAEPQRPFGSQPARDIPALVLCLLVGAASSAAGIGGGAFFVPLFDIVVALGVRSATALSQVCISAGALTACAARARARHPLHPDRPLIDVDLALLATPPLLLGVSGGLLAQHAFPSWLITFILIVVLLAITADTAGRGLKLHRREQAAAAAAADAVEVVAEGGGVAGGGGAGSPRHRRAATASTLSLDGEGLAAILSRVTSRPPPTTDWWDGGAASDAGGWRRTQSLAVSPPLAAASADAAARAAAGRARFRTASLPLRPAAASSVATASPRAPAGWGAVAEDGGSVGAASSLARSSAVAPSSAPPSAFSTPAPSQPGSVATSVAKPDIDGVTQAAGSTAPAGGAARASARATAWACYAALAAMFAVMTALQVLRSLSTRCSRTWVAAIGAQAAVSAAATAGAAAFLVAKHGGARAARAKAAAAAADATPAALAPYGTGEIDYSLRSVASSTVVALASGVLASLLGLGGGILMVPLFLSLGAHPASAAATSTLMVLFSATSAAAGQAAAGYVLLSFALAFGIASLVAGVLGAGVVSLLVARTGKGSPLVWLLTAVIGGGAVMTLGYGGMEAVRQLRAWGPDAHFHGMCDP